MQCYFLLAISVAFATLSNCLFHKIGEKQLDNRSVWLFNALSCGLSLLMLGCLNGGISPVQKSTVIFGVAYGIATAVFLMAKMMALSSGPITVTTLIGNCSLIIPTLFGILYYRESAGAMQQIGFLLIIVALVLCVKASDGAPRCSRRWLLWCCLFFAAAGTVSVVFKLYQASPGKNEINGMMMIAYGVAAGVLLVASLANRHAPAVMGRVIKRDIGVWLVGCALSSTVYNRLNIYLSGAMNSIVFFPIFNGGVILLATLLGVFLYRERLQARQIVGIILGAIAILLIGLF